MDHTKTVFAFIGFMIAGFLALFFGRMPLEDSGQYGKMLTNYQIHTYARENCVKAARSQLSQPLYMPTETKPDGSNALVLTWSPSAESPHAVLCRYEEGKGVTEVKIDGAPSGPISIDISDDPASHAPGAWVEKHWGH
jgi:hypothetical protein